MKRRYVVRVTDVIERDTDRVLVGGDDVITGDRVTFHVRTDSRRLRQIETGVRTGQHVLMDLTIPTPKENDR